MRRQGHHQIISLKFPITIVKTRQLNIIQSCSLTLVPLENLSSSSSLGSLLTFVSWTSHSCCLPYLLNIRPRPQTAAQAHDLTCYFLVLGPVEKICYWKRETNDSARDWIKGDWERSDSREAYFKNLSICITLFISEYSKLCVGVWWNGDSQKIKQKKLLLAINFSKKNKFKHNKN